MSNDSSVVGKPPRAARAAVVVDPSIAAVIENPGAPVGSPPLREPPSSLPGKVGTTVAVPNIVRLQRVGAEQSASVRNRFGDIYRWMLANRPAVFVWSPEEIQKILKNEDSAWSAGMGWQSTVFASIDRRGKNVGALMSLDFDDHRAARKLVQPAFTLKALQGYVEIANRGFGRALPEWLARRTIDFKPEMRTLLAHVAGEIFTGIHDPAKVAVLDRALSDFWHGMTALSKRPWLSPKLRRARRGFETLVTMFTELVPERRRRGGADLFSQMCVVEDKAGLSDDAMVRIFVSVMFGAFDTTSAAMTSMAYLLAKHQGWQDRLREEAQRVPAEKLDASRVRDLAQLDWVWKETLRLMPVAGNVPRRTLREVEVGGHVLPPGTLVSVMMGSLGRHPAWWKDPDRFDPERFSPERAEDKQSGGIHLPFGAGPHACVGMQLANLEMKLFWHKVLTSCRFALSPYYEARHTYTPMGCVSGKVTLQFERL